MIYQQLQDRDPIDFSRFFLHRLRVALSSPPCFLIFTPFIFLKALPEGHHLRGANSWITSNYKIEFLRDFSRLVLHWLRVGLSSLPCFLSFVNGLGFEFAFVLSSSSRSYFLAALAALYLVRWLYEWVTMMPFRVIDAAMRASGQLASNFLTQASWRLYEIRLDCVQPLTS